MKKELILFSLILAAVTASACSSNVSASIMPAEAEHIPTVETAAPSPEPEYEIGSPVTVEGKNIASYLVRDEICVKNSELKDACNYDINTDERYVPILEWAQENGIGTLYDEEYDHYYLTRAAGTWTYPSGYNVPVMMYHEVQSDDYGASEDTVKVTDFENEMEYLYQNGFTPIWFEDLEHVDEIEKPIILTFDDGYVGNYDYVYPILERYNFKATIFVFTTRVYNLSRYMTDEQISELAQTDLIQIQSHTVNHTQLDTVDETQQEYELNQSKLEITRLANKIPYVLAYPYGASTSYVDSEIENGNYRFGVKMIGLRAYNTSDDCYTVWRFYPQRSMTLSDYSSLVESAFECE